MLAQVDGLVGGVLCLDCGLLVMSLWVLVLVEGGYNIDIPRKACFRVLYGWVNLGCCVLGFAPGFGLV